MILLAKKLELETAVKLNLKINFKTILLFLLLIAFLAVSISFVFVYPNITTSFIKILFFLLLAGLFIAFLTLYFLKKEMLTKLFFVLQILVSLVMLGYLLLQELNILELLASAEQLKQFILSTGEWGQVAFVLLQFTQVAFIPIPALVTTLVGVAIYGPLITAILSTIAIILGSLFSFFVWGRVFGYKMVSWIAGKETTDKYRELLNEKGKYLLILMFLFPMFPDDILCMVAGITTMKAKFFIIVTLMTRPITTFLMCYLADGTIIPYSGWGLFAWGIILLLTGAIFIYTYKNSHKIDLYLEKLRNKLENKKKKAK